MKSKFLKRVVLCCIIAFFVVGCTSDSEKEVDYSKYDFADVTWTRESDCDVETLRFLPNGEFRYSCACGNPVNDADVVESYTYDDATKTFTLNCYEEVDDMITEIKLVSCDGEKLKLDFDGEIREFTVE